MEKEDKSGCWDDGEDIGVRGEDGGTSLFGESYFKRVKGYRKIKDAKRTNQVCMERSPNAKYSKRVSI